MAISRGRFGIEYFPRPRDGESRVAGWLIAVVAVVAAALVVVAVARRIMAKPDIPPEVPSTESAAVAEVRPPPSPLPASPPAPPSPPPIPPGAERDRPQVACNLLLKLEKAVAANDVELAVSAIEQLRALPGEAVADLDDKLARKLGALNIQRLFARRNRQWVKEVEVRRGDSVSRVAFESGSTLASLLKLNSLKSADHIRIGQKLFVMDHPKFVLVVHRAAKYADLSLKGKFFRRYDIVAPVVVAEGNYSTGTRLRTFLSEKGISFSAADRAELETLLPANTPVLVSER